MSVCLQNISKISKKRFCGYNTGTIENKRWSTSWVDPKTVVEPYPDPKRNPLGLQKVKNDPKIKSNSKVGIEGIIENESCSPTYADIKTPYEP